MHRAFANLYLSMYSVRVLVSAFLLSLALVGHSPNANAAASLKLLKALSKKALEVRYERLPFLLSPSTQVTLMQRLVGKVVADEFNQESTDRQILDCLRQANQMGMFEACDLTAYRLMTQLLFDAGKIPESENLIPIENPSFENFSKFRVEGKLLHHTYLPWLMQILEYGRVGKTEFEELNQKLTSQVASRVSGKMSYTLAAYNSTRTYLQWFHPDKPIDAETKWYPVVIRFKMELLKRWDYHFNGSWNWGAYTLCSLPMSSFAPADGDKFLTYCQSTEKNNNELVFYNPIPVSLIESIYVWQGARAQVQAHLEDLKLSTIQVIPVSVGDDSLTYDEIFKILPSPRNLEEDRVKMSAFIESILNHPDQESIFQSSTPADQDLAEKLYVEAMAKN